MSGASINHKPTWIGDQLRRMTSLDTPPDQSLGEEATDFGLSLTPGVGTVMAGRDTVRSLREGNYGSAALDSLGLIPGGKLAAIGGKLGAAKLATFLLGRKHGKTMTHQASMDKAEMLAQKGASEQDQWYDTGKQFGDKYSSFVDPIDKHPKFEVRTPDPDHYLYKPAEAYLKAGGELDKQPLRNVLNNKELFDLAPELRDATISGKVAAGNNGPTRAFPGRIDKTSGLWTPAHMDVNPEKMEDFYKWTNHEGRHFGQDISPGHSPGGNPSPILNKWVVDILRTKTPPAGPIDAAFVRSHISDPQLDEMIKQSKRAYAHQGGEARAFGGEQRLSELLKSKDFKVYDKVPTELDPRMDPKKIWDRDIPAYDDWMK